ncbi:response regulator [Mucilaginibacter lappiensis]|uniref:Two-component system phosphate regulon response regulator PhoB n=1 Tax=Mucilaginibacter lappiensis TaxID=354630 RepID=A0A1N6Z0L4_9SPHI|nr:response regulator [Mucilaginibacter lappiensis]MBB6109929.1 two-component system phosphate regulon response regulator PhoB [Mucilaginibacter lappiensis]MBB6131237.1 two-component system phosphate regulon response regulator PhoB [Mucilaginibacter lappiensis]SIR20330.1 two-component system, OmpR family, phosphate regulon response regulator PhoB [Mucilaginibacter lappiensis]
MRRILAVDDDSDILEVLQYILEDSGYEVITLADGHHLFDKIKESQPDLILLDIMLGNLDGRDLCKSVKTGMETHGIPVILISASHEVSRTLNQTGAPDDFIAKPFDIDVLLRSINRQLDNAA